MRHERNKQRADEKLAEVIEGLDRAVCQYGDGAEVGPPAGHPFDEVVKRFGDRLSRVTLPDWACDVLGLPGGADYRQAAAYLYLHAPALNATLEVEDALLDLDPADRGACDRLAALAADAAFTTRFPERFGYFPGGGGRCVVFANMGPNPGQRLAAEVLRQFLDDAGVRELGFGVSPGDGYTWAMVIDSPDGQGWCDVVRRAWRIAWA